MVHLNQCHTQGLFLKVSVIIAFYKDLEALELILEALERQTYSNIEVVVAEDNNDPQTVLLLDKFRKSLDIIHNSHEDIGRTKAAAQNKAICAASGEYLIFIDGDCVPYSTFVEGHVALSAKKKVLSGRRVNVDADLSKKMRQHKLKTSIFEKYYLYYVLTDLVWRKKTHYEQGFYIKPNGTLYNKFITNKKRNVQILGCNFSCYKEDFVAINGFDESYGLSILGDDTDLNWRFVDYGATISSCKNVANVFHLDHKRPSYPDYDPSEDLARFNKVKAEHKFFCDEGLNKYC